MVRAALVALLLTTLGVSAAPAAVQLDPYPRKQFVFGRASVRLRITVEPDARNRLLAWGIDSELYSSESSRQLDGASAPRTFTLMLKDLPPGHYTLFAVLRRADGEQQFVDSFDVLGADEP